MFRARIRHTALLAALATPMVLAQPPSGAPPATNQRARGPGLSLAVEAAQTAVARCNANGYQVTVLIVDSAGVPVVLLSEGAPERTQTIAGRKAAASIRYNGSSGDITERAKTDAALAAEIKADPKIGVAGQGALLLTAHGETVGAIAVSGAPGGEKDEACAQAAIDKVKDRL